MNKLPQNGSQAKDKWRRALQPQDILKQRDSRGALPAAPAKPAAHAVPTSPAVKTAAPPEHSPPQLQAKLHRCRYFCNGCGIQEVAYAVR